MNKPESPSLSTIKEVENVSSLDEVIRLCKRLDVDYGKAASISHLQERLLRALKDRGVRGNSRPVSSEQKQRGKTARGLPKHRTHLRRFRFWRSPNSLLKCSKRGKLS